MDSSHRHRDVPHVLIPFDRREAMTLREAADHSGFSEDTVQRWAALKDIGRKIGGRWMVSKVALTMYLESDFAALEAYLAGDRRSEMVADYFDRMR